MVDSRHTFYFFKEEIKEARKMGRKSERYLVSFYANLSD